MQDAPAVLVVQLKRFEFSLRSRSKISKRVDFETTLDLAPFMSNRLVTSLSCHIPIPNCRWTACMLQCDCLDSASIPKSVVPFAPRHMLRTTLLS